MLAEVIVSERPAAAWSKLPPAPPGMQAPVAEAGPVDSLPRFRVVGPIVFIAIFFAAWGALTGIFTFAQTHLALGLELGTKVPVRISITATGRKAFCVRPTAGGRFWWICWTTVMR